VLIPSTNIGVAVASESLEIDKSVNIVNGDGRCTLLWSGLNWTDPSSYTWRGAGPRKQT